MSQTHNENSRVKIPAVLHLMRLGYDYLSLKNENWDKQTNIFPKIFIESLCRINPNLSPDDARRLLANIRLELDNEDLGQKFYERLTNQSGGKKLIDFQNFNNNSFHVVTELPCINGDEEFRPDITLLVNGMPLVFIEVKKPNNKGGIGEERERMGKRAKNPKFRRFINITQFMIFSNNMEYDDGATEPAQGAFYASSAYGKPVFNYFREEHKLNLAELLNTLSDDLENKVLQDNNLPVIKHSPEFISNKSPDTPTNRILTSLLCRERLSFLLQHGLTYVKASQGSVQKHIMRYPQLFATLAIEKHLANGGKKGVIWHTQGSGKTALAYLGRLIKAHNLLQTLTRVNRTYKSYRYGYVVDFADIEREFDKTNRAYWDELSNELGDEIGSYSQLFKTAEEIEQEIVDIKNALFDFDTENAEEFCSQISQIEDKKQLLALKKALQTAKELYNILRLQGSHEFLEHLDFDKLNLLYRETAARLDTLNLAEKLQQGDTAHLLNEALEDVYFQFVKIGEAELKIADDLKDIMRKVREGLAGNFDQDDPEYISLREELERIFKKKNLAEVGQEEMQANIATLETVYAKIKELNRQNDLLRHKYGGDAKYARTHKRLMENPALYGDKLKVFNALNGVKTDADQKVLDMEQILDNQNYFEKQMQGIVLKRFRTEQQFPVQPQDIQAINRLLVREYLEEKSRICGSGFSGSLNHL